MKIILTVALIIFHINVQAAVRCENVFRENATPGPGAPLSARDSVVTSLAQLTLDIAAMPADAHKYSLLEDLRAKVDEAVQAFGPETKSLLQAKVAEMSGDHQQAAVAKEQEAEARKQAVDAQRNRAERWTQVRNHDAVIGPEGGFDFVTEKKVVFVEEGQVVVFDTAASRVERTIPVDNLVTAAEIEVTADGQFAFVLDSANTGIGKPQRINLQTGAVDGEIVLSKQDEVYMQKLSPSSKFAAYVHRFGHDVQIYDARTLGLVKKFPRKDQGHSVPGRLIFAADEKYLMDFGKGARSRLFDLTTMKEIKIKETGDGADLNNRSWTNAVFVPGADMLIAISKAGRYVKVDLKTGVLTETPFQHSVNGQLVISADGKKLLVFNEGNDLQATTKPWLILDTATMTEIPSPLPAWGKPGLLAQSKNGRHSLFFNQRDSMTSEKTDRQFVELDARTLEPIISHAPARFDGDPHPGVLDAEGNTAALPFRSQSWLLTVGQPD